MKRILPFILSLLLLCGVFGCATKSAPRENSASNAKAQDNYYDGAYYAEPSEPEEFGYGENPAAPAPNPSQALSNRKIIRNADMTVETLSFDAFLEQLTGSLNGFGGYVESSSVGTRGYKNLRFARYTVRVPADSLDVFLNAVSGLGNVTALSTGLRDVTTNYVDSEKHLESLRVEQQALLEILAKAETVEDIITVQDRLTYVRYEIESYEAILRTYDDQIALSSVVLTVNEVEKETPVEKETFGQEVSRRFGDSLENVGDGFKNFGAWLFGNAPEIIVTLIIIGGIAVAIVFIIRGSIRRSRKKKEKAAARKAEESETAPEQK